MTYACLTETFSFVELLSESKVLLCTEKAGTERWAFALQHAYDLSGIALFPWGKVGQLKHAVGDVRLFFFFFIAFFLLPARDVLYTRFKIAFIKTAFKLALLKANYEI